MMTRREMLSAFCAVAGVVLSSELVPFELGATTDGDICVAGGIWDVTSIERHRDGTITIGITSRVFDIELGDEHQLDELVYGHRIRGTFRVARVERRLQPVHGLRTLAKLHGRDVSVLPPTLLSFTAHSGSPLRRDPPTTPVRA